ncbi:hypothetical protein [Dokdonella sp.]|uniref:hypothetical protein n=1 Tax=Dokdonella sp. TaxID=2291710 RepID=UPI002F4040C5
MGMRFWIPGLLFVIASACALASPRGRPPAGAAEGTWLTWGGQASFGFNPDALASLDLSIASAAGAIARTHGAPGKRYDATTFAALDAGALELIHRGPTIVAIGGGELRFGGGFVLAHPGGSIDLRGFALRADPAARLGIAVVDAGGRVLFTADHAHYGFDEQGPGTFSMYNMNLRLAAEFAHALGRPDLAGLPVGSLEFRARAQIGRDEALSPDGGVCSAPFEGPGLVTNIALIYDDAASGWTGHDDSVYVRRCGLPPLPNGGSCTSASTNGKVVIDQDSSLRNVGDTGVAWYQKFTSPSPPYGNDQHPYLIWNLYRVDAAGRIKQIGVSAVKHAFLTINWAHVNGECGCAEGHVIYPTCEDTYSLSNNDNSSSGGSQQQNLAPRGEVIPSSAIWGRCGSVWDANCDGAMDAGSGAQNLYDYRMLVDESDMLAPLATGARYFFEYWYIVRDDADIYDTMGYREIHPAKNGSSWQVSLVGADAPDHDFFLGPTLNRWVDPLAPSANAMNRELSTPLGRARIAVKATDLGGGQWRYEYAVMNFDYAHVRIDPAHPAEPNLKLLENRGFARFGVPLAGGASASAVRFDDADNDAGNDWVASIAGGTITWSAPVAGNTLDWGRLYHFEFVSNAPPSSATLDLVGAATSTEPDIGYTLDLLAPVAVDDTIFRNGFD